MLVFDYKITHTHWSAWPTVGCGTFHLRRSPAMSHVGSAQCPLSNLICLVQEWQGWPHKHLQCAGWQPDLAFTALL